MRDFMDKKVKKQTKGKDFIDNKTLDLGLMEEVYSMNFDSRYRDVLDFTQASWNLCVITLELADGITLTPKQRVIILMLGKFKRLLRAIYKLIIIGYWPEAEIIFRTLFEAKVLLVYIFDDLSEKTAEDWLNNKNSRKNLKTMKGLMSNYENLFEKYYKGACMYAHNNILSISYYVQLKNGKFSMLDGPVNGGEDSLKNAAGLLGQCAMEVGAMCELAVEHFEVTAEWETKNMELKAKPYFKKEFKKVLKTLPKIQEDVERLINKQFGSSSKK